jgi:hypothetical protein
VSAEGAPALESGGFSQGPSVVARGRSRSDARHAPAQLRDALLHVRCCLPQAAPPPWLRKVGVSAGGSKKTAATAAPRAARWRRRRRSGGGAPRTAATTSGTALSYSARCGRKPLLLSHTM